MPSFVVIILGIFALIYVVKRAAVLRRRHISEVCAEAFLAEKPQELVRDYLKQRQLTHGAKPQERAWTQRLMVVFLLHEPRTFNLENAKTMLIGDQFKAYSATYEDRTKGLEYFAGVLTRLIATELMIEQRKTLSKVTTTLQVA